LTSIRADREKEYEVTEGSATPAGWYSAQGDPPGTQRYWDGGQWVGEPQPTQPTSVGGFSYGQQAAPSVGPGSPATYGTRVVAWLIDLAVQMAVVFALWLVVVVAELIRGGPVKVVFGLAVLGYLGFSLWYLAVRQGSTGQTIGKGRQNIKLAKASGANVGVGLAFARFIIPPLLPLLFFAGFLFFAVVVQITTVAFFFLVITILIGAIVSLVDYLWPLWDDENKRLIDKILKLGVVRV